MRLYFHGLYNTILVSNASNGYLPLRYFLLHMICVLGQSTFFFGTLVQTASKGSCHSPRSRHILFYLSISTLYTVITSTFFSILHRALRISIHCFTPCICPTFNMTDSEVSGATTETNPVDQAFSQLWAEARRHAILFTVSSILNLGIVTAGKLAPFPHPQAPARSHLIRPKGLILAYTVPNASLWIHSMLLTFFLIFFGASLWFSATSVCLAKIAFRCKTNTLVAEPLPILKMATLSESPFVDNLDKPVLMVPEDLASKV